MPAGMLPARTRTSPLREWESRGLCEFVKGPEINPELPAQWFDSMNEHYNILRIGIDKYRYTLMSKALAEYGFNSVINALTPNNTSPLLQDL